MTHRFTRQGSHVGGLVPGTKFGRLVATADGSSKAKERTLISGTER
jgi:hypothetical protein